MAEPTSGWDRESKYVLETLKRIEDGIEGLRHSAEAVQHSVEEQAQDLVQLEARFTAHEASGLRLVALASTFASIATASIFSALNHVVAKAMGG